MLGDRLSMDYVLPKDRSFALMFNSRASLFSFFICRIRKFLKPIFGGVQTLWPRFGYSVSLCDLENVFCMAWRGVVCLYYGVIVMTSRRMSRFP
jgi:hypothetical protein